MFPISGQNKFSTIQFLKINNWPKLLKYQILQHYYLLVYNLNIVASKSVHPTRHRIARDNAQPTRPVNLLPQRLFSITT